MNVILFVIFLFTFFFIFFFFFSSRRRHTRWNCDWSSDVCSSDLHLLVREGDATDPEALDAAVAGQDAVLSALGVRSPLADDLITPSLRALVPAMQKHGVSRLIWLSALDRKSVV